MKVGDILITVSHTVSNETHKSLLFSFVRVVESVFLSRGWVHLTVACRCVSQRSSFQLYFLQRTRAFAIYVSGGLLSCCVDEGGR
jgi:hypothetical protein